MIKLKKKEVYRENMLLLEKQGHKRKRLNKELDIVRAQYA